jgi:hypothetical protein
LGSMLPGAGPRPRKTRSSQRRRPSRPLGNSLIVPGISSPVSSWDGVGMTRHTSWLTVSRPVGGVLFALAGEVAIHLSGLPGDCPMGRAGYPCPTFGLAPGGVYRAGRITPAAGALLPHRFTLACAGLRSPSAVCSLLHFPSGRPDWQLASTLALWSPDLPRRSLPPKTELWRGHPADSPSPSVCQVGPPSRHAPTWCRGAVRDHPPR